MSRSGLRPILVLSASLVLAGSAVSFAATVVNGDFEAGHGTFNVPVGWVPFGMAKCGPAHEGNWKVQVSDAHARQQLGLYQVIPHATLGMRYRLTARARAGRDLLPVRIGLIPERSIDCAKAAWSTEHKEKTWTALSAEAVARDTAMVVVLEMRNLHEKYQLLEAGAFDNVQIEELGREAALPTSRPVHEWLVPAPSDVYANLANLWSLAWPKSGVRTFEASTHDPDPAGNRDFDRFESRVQLDGREWAVLKSLKGPGAIVRVWMTNFPKEGYIRIEIDGKTVESGRIIDYFGSPGTTTWPLANATSGAWMCYTPMPFAQSARVMISGGNQERFYWQITYQLFSGTRGLRPFTDPLNPTDAAYLQQVRDQWATATLNPKPPYPGTQEISKTIDVPAGEAIELWSQKESGMIDAFWIDALSGDENVLQGLRLQATWDDAASPQIDAPLGLFFSAGYGRTINRGLMVGMAPPDGGYCYFPMPYGQSARLAIGNTTGEAVKTVRFRIRWVPLEVREISPLRFHARALHDPRAGEGKLHTLLETSGRGHLVGVSAAMACGNRKDEHFLEGDEYIRVDGEKEPSSAGTGTEDYFTCGWYFIDGPITLTPIGATEIDRKLHRVSAYRLHLPDWVPFDRSLEFAIEVGDSANSPEYGDYTTVCYYYLDFR
jgi:hypothetical protein